MRSDVPDELHIESLIDAIHQAIAFIHDTSFEEFEFDDKTSSAVIRKLEVIGESSKNLSATFKSKYPHIPWTDMIRTRDKIAHDYIDVDLAIVWDIVTLQLPTILDQLKVLEN